MSAATQSASYGANGFTEPTEARDHFARQFDLANPEEARDSYQRIMHQHTRQQFEMATESSRRRSSGATMASLKNESSVDSTAS
ncbi:hypothetical protein TI39_contig440g00004 [Zymoseptoria brevis]|uniref:Uncharacterized protein n=1 Tax=Zymoseptoria brevis TaxID=1047168 RepID=A0A0F4GKX2_9PEZI|nr:hypothetical protein TI39_contig440g00004 [Zymoseptoria brevis]